MFVSCSVQIGLSWSNLDAKTSLEWPFLAYRWPFWPIGGHFVSLEIIQIIILSYFLVVWHVCVMFYPDWAYLTEIRSQNITRMTIIGLSAAILVSGGHFVSLEIIQIIIIS